MKRKDLLELRRRVKKEDASFTKICGCFVNTEKNILLEFQEEFYNLDEDDNFRYLDIAKKALSGKIGNNILNLNFSKENPESPSKQNFLFELKKSKLKEENLLREFYDSVIEEFEYEGNYLILLFHDVYDIIAKTNDNSKLDESEEVYEYILCAICPVSLSKPSLFYHEEEKVIKSRLRDWLVEAPINGFVYPAFIDRGQDLNSLIYYTKNPKDINSDLIEKVLGCMPRDTQTIQKSVFEAIVTGSISADEEEANLIYMDIQENLNSKFEDYKLSSIDKDEEPIRLSKKDLEDVLKESGIDEENITMIEEIYEENFSQDLPLVEGLIDKKVLKAGEQTKKERKLKKQVDFLKEKLENLSLDEEYDIIVQAKSHKMDDIRSEVIEGQEYLLIPVGENVKTTINKL